MRVTLLWIAVASLLALSAGEVHMLEGEELVDEDSGAEKMWYKGKKLPPETNAYKTINGYEHHGKCRFACYKDKGCGGYSWTPATHLCKLLSAPGFFANPASNDKWHKGAAKITGAKYKSDKHGKRKRSKLQKKLKNYKKVKPITKRPKTVGGRVHLGLEAIANKSLKRLAKKGKSNLKMKVKRASLYSEFTKSYQHEYEARAERKIAKKARHLAGERIKKSNAKHPGTKISKKEAHTLFTQARKEVEGQTVRKMQRSFKKHLKDWVESKMNAAAAEFIDKKADAKGRNVKALAKEKVKLAAAKLSTKVAKAKATAKKVVKAKIKKVTAKVNGKAKKKAAKKKAAKKKAEKAEAAQATTNEPAKQKKKKKKPTEKKLAEKKPTEEKLAELS